MTVSSPVTSAGVKTPTCPSGRYHHSLDSGQGPDAPVARSSLPSEGPDPRCRRRRRLAGLGLRPSLTSQRPGRGQEPAQPQRNRDPPRRAAPKPRGVSKAAPHRRHRRVLGDSRHVPSRPSVGPSTAPIPPRASRGGIRRRASSVAIGARILIVDGRDATVFHAPGRDGLREQIFHDKWDQGTWGP